MSDRPNTVDVLLPYALAGCYSYSVPPHVEVAAGDFVHVPLGTRHTVGVVWGDRPQPAADLKLRPIAARIELPPLPELTRRVIEWIAAYYLEPVGNILRLCLRVPGVFDARRETIGYVAGPVEPERLTPQRTRVLEVARQGVPLRASELAAEAAVGVGVVHGLARQGALRGVALSPFTVFGPTHLMDPDKGVWTDAGAIALCSSLLLAVIAGAAIAWGFREGSARAAGRPCGWAR